MLENAYITKADREQKRPALTASPPPTMMVVVVMMMYIMMLVMIKIL